MFKLSNRGTGSFVLIFFLLFSQSPQLAFARTCTSAFSNPFTTKGFFQMGRRFKSKELSSAGELVREMISRGEEVIPIFGEPRFDAMIDTVVSKNKYTIKVILILTNKLQNLGERSSGIDTSYAEFVYALQAGAQNFLRTHPHIKTVQVEYKTIKNKGLAESTEKQNFTFTDAENNFFQIKRWELIPN